MKKILNVFKAIIAIMVLLVTFIACDKDFTTIGTDVIGDIHFEAKDTAYSAITYNKKLNPVQANGLSSNLLGIYQDPIFGDSESSIVSQMSLQSQPTGVNIQLDSVVLTVPYFSHVNVDDSTDENGRTNYILDSVYGISDVPMKLSIYKNNYLLRDLDPDTGFEDSQKYYSNGSTSEGSIIPTSELESELVYENDQFSPDPEQILLTELNSDGEPEESGRLDPSLRIVFKDAFGFTDMQFWQELIIDKLDEPELSNNNNFKDYFRGLFFKLEDVSGEGSMFMLDFSSATSNITLHYKSVNAYEDEENGGLGDGIPDSVDADVDGDGNIDDGKVDTDGDEIIDSADMDADGDGMDDEDKIDINNDGFDDTAITVNENSFVLSFSGNRVNVFNNNFNAIIDNVDSNANEVTGDDKLYLKGGEGSMAIINLFGGEESDEFEEFKANQGDWLINEANLVFYEDENLLNPENHEYDRLYVYDLNNNRPVVDYFFDTPSATPINSIVNHLGKRYTDEMGNNKFKIRITEHINNILLKDSTNTKLGLVLSTNVNSFQNGDVLGTTNEDDLNKVPSGAILSPKGTILHGNNSGDIDKKVKLEIYYTEPNN